MELFHSRNWRPSRTWRFHTRGSLSTLEIGNCWKVPERFQKFKLLEKDLYSKVNLHYSRSQDLAFWLAMPNHLRERRTRVTFFAENGLLNRPKLMPFHWLISTFPSHSLVHLMRFGACRSQVQHTNTSVLKTVCALSSLERLHGILPSSQNFFSVKAILSSLFCKCIRLLRVF